MRLVLATSFGLFIACAGAANAQLVQDIATDQELFAGYCLGQVQQRSADFGQGYGLASVDRAVIRDIEDRTSRLKTYLAARGFFGVRGPQAKNGITLAITRGRGDESSCRSHVTSCLDKCTHGLSVDQKCTNECRDLDRSCTATARCESDDQLPF